MTPQRGIDRRPPRWLIGGGASSIAIQISPFNGATPAVVTPPGGGGNNNCTSADNCKARQMPDGKVWMTENLNIATDDSWCYNNSPDSCAKYWRLYAWNAAMAVCPMGWHLPSQAEWDTLMATVGGPSTAGTKLKSTNGWNNNNGQSGNGTNSFGFSALPGGFQYQGNFQYVGDNGYWWTATEHAQTSAAFVRYIRYDSDYLNEGITSTGNGYSVRCAGD